MRIFLWSLFVVVIIAATGGYIYWNSHKKAFIKDSIDKALDKKTDSLYYIHYDSSSINEATGSASFYNVSLQSDSAQQALLKSTDSLPDKLFNIHIKEIKISGVDFVGLLSNNVAAQKILLDKPVINIINTGFKKADTTGYNDTLELYQKILGKLKSIKAGKIEIANGTVFMTDKNGKPLTTVENINVSLNNFLIDSNHNYQNIISYFVKDIKVSVENIQLPESKNNTRINIAGIAYDAAKRMLSVKEIQQYQLNNTAPLVDLKNIIIDGLNTAAFINAQQLKAGVINCDGGLITIYKTKKSTKKAKEKYISFSSEMIEEAQVAGMKLGNTKVIILDTINKVHAKPLVLENVQFVVSAITGVTDGSKISDIITDAQWQLSIGYFYLFSKDKMYKLSSSGIQVDNGKKTIAVKDFLMKPLLTREQMRRKSVRQTDIFDLSFNNILLNGVDFKKLIADNQLMVNTASLQPVIKVFKDRTLPSDTSSKVDKYPHQAFLKLKFPVHVNRLYIKDGYASYGEKAAKSKMAGTVFFAKINGVIANVTNIKEQIKINPSLTLNATALFMGVGKMNSQWRLPLNTEDTTFNVSAHLSEMNTQVLNPLTKPLGLVSINKGEIKLVDFDFTGGNYKAWGNFSFLYNDLHIDVLKPDSNKLETKNGISSIANALLINDNPSNGKTRTAIVNNNRDTTKSFFNLIWKTIFVGVKKIVLGENINKVLPKANN